MAATSLMAGDAMSELDRLAQFIGHLDALQLIGSQANQLTAE